MNKERRSLAALLAFLTTQLTVEVAMACDPCALFNSSRLSETKAGSFSASIYTQFTSFEEPKALPRDGDVTRSYDTTQLTGSYDLSHDLSVDLTVPFIARRYDTYRGYRSGQHTEEGLGDVATVLSYSPVVLKSVDYSLAVSLAGGVKFPTGDSGSIEQSLSAEPDTERSASIDAVSHHSVTTSTGIGGRILSIGTGSYDFPLLTAFAGRYGRLLLSGYVQYTFRTEGDFDYRFDNDLVWGVSAGRFLMLEDDYTLALAAALEGEHKGQDTFRGSHVDDSQLGTIYLGPTITGGYSGGGLGDLSVDGLTVEIGFGVPIQNNDSDQTTAPDYRLHAGLTARF